MQCHVYILLCDDGTYYTGSTKYLNLRLKQHFSGEGANHTKKHKPIKLVYTECFNRIDYAFNREKQIQRWSHAKKEALINGEIDVLEKKAKKKFEKKEQ